MTLIDAFFNFFKFLCILATAFMVGFWLVKFKQDHDVTLIEYKAIEDFDELIHPVTTLCFYKSFYMNKSLNALEYIDYLEGKRKDVNRYHDIDYDKVSVNLHEHFRNITIRWKPSKTPSDSPCKDVNDCQYYNLKNNYNGFSNEGHFIKCFGIEVNKTYAKDVSSMSVFFNKNLKNAIGTSWMVQAFFNYPNQFTRPRGGPITIWQKKENNGSHYNHWEFIQITSIELLKRRNKRDKKCTTQWSRFDDLLLERHVKSVGCRAPYISDFAEFPMCNTQVGMKKSSYWGLSLQKAYNLEDPCQEMPNIDFKHAAIRTYNLNVFGVQIGFPSKGKIITQLQEVDAHSLIGNIGGYIGLFLGKF